MNMIDNSILVVDDDPMIVQHIFETLVEEHQSYTFLQANNGQVAFNVALQKHPKLIITDWDMPGMNGIELIRALKADLRTADIPVIMATGVMVTSDHLKYALEAGAVDFIRKPLDAIELKARVNAMITLSDHIGEIKLMGDTIKEFNYFLQNLINILPYPVVHYDAEGAILTFNQSFGKAFNAGNEIFKSYYEYFKNDSADIHAENDRKIFEKGASEIKYESVVTFADGSKHEVVFTKVPVFGNNGEVKGILAVLGDLTELKQQHEQTLQKQKSELAGISMRLVQTSELNEKMMRDIDKLLTSNDPSVREIAANIAASYRLALNENMWVEFEKRFNDVHIDFYLRLSAKHPDLSSNERKLCAFLRLNMSTKEIAAVTFQNGKSIDMARYRLRKRLGLDADDSLQNYLAQV